MTQTVSSQPVGAHGASRAGAPGRSTTRRRALARIAFGALACTTPSARASGADAMQRAARAQGWQAVAGVKALQAIFTALGDTDDPAKLGPINQFFNRRIAYGTDLEVWGQLDYWASPVELLGKGRGDCEDYVIGKYFSLLVTGVPVAKMRLVYVRALIEGRLVEHMVLAYYPAPGAEPLVLDSLTGDIRPAMQRPDLQPVFSFNSEGLWHGAGSQVASDPADRLSPWREVCTKARAEGFQ